MIQRIIRVLFSTRQIVEQGVDGLYPVGQEGCKGHVISRQPEREEYSIASLSPFDQITPCGRAQRAAER